MNTPFIVSVVLVTLAGFSAPPATPDIVERGWHKVEFVVKVDAGALASSAFRSYVTKEGDTLAEIAKRECGDAACANEIRLVNSEVKWEALQPGTALMLPPRVAAADSRGQAETRTSAPASWLLYLVSWDGLPTCAPTLMLPLADDLPAQNVRGEAIVVAIRRDQLRWFLGLDWSAVNVKNPPEGMILSSAVESVGVLRDSDRAAKIEVRARLRAIEKSRISCDFDERKFDRRGKLISEGRRPDGERGTRRGELLTLGGIACVAIAGVIGLARRRRAALRAGSAPGDSPAAP